jgi:hypothetical protein
MTGKFMSREAIRNTRKAMEAVNSRQRRAGTDFAVNTIACGCSDPGCGAFHRVDTERPLPTIDEAVTTMKAKKRSAKRPKLQPTRRSPGE